MGVAVERRLVDDCWDVAALIPPELIRDLFGQMIGDVRSERFQRIAQIGGREPPLDLVKRVARDRELCARIRLRRFRLADCHDRDGVVLIDRECIEPLSLRDGVRWQNSDHRALDYRCRSAARQDEQRMD